MNQNLKPAAFAVAVGMILGATPAFAYVGPGAGLSAIGSVLAFLGVIFLTIVGFVWYPVKRLLARLRKSTDGAAQESENLP